MQEAWEKDIPKKSHAFAWLFSLLASGNIAVFNTQYDWFSR